MKKIFSFLLLVFVGYVSYAQTVNAEYLNPVSGSTSQYKYLRFGTSADYWAGFMNNVNDPAYGNGGDFSILTYGNRDLTIRTGTGNFIMFPSLAGGRVGVGTTSPQTLFHLRAGNSREQLRLQSGGDAYAYFELEFTVNSTSGFKAGSAYGWNMSHRKDGFFSGNKDGSSMEFYGYKLGGGYVAPLAFKSNGDVILASPRQATSGNVGIGTISPDSKLTVAGKIHAQEVKVTIAAGADFVFADDYALPTLQQVESFIKENRHLPEIPSAAEMQENGLHLAEMNIKLLQKVEELTLYVIEQQKQIQILQSQVLELKK